ncbi:MAG TPA: hypothetical protein PLZ79_06950 [Burkholderiales bacterium]|nr:hypothetical protein [Burkholderiales bacterium]
MEMAMETGRMGRFGGFLIHYYLVSPGMTLRAEPSIESERSPAPRLSSREGATLLEQRWTRKDDGSLASNWEITG